MYGMAGMGLVVLLVVCGILFAAFKWIVGPYLTRSADQTLAALKAQQENHQQQMFDQKTGYLSLIGEIRSSHANEIEARDRTLVNISENVGRMAGSVEQLRAHVTGSIDALRREFHEQLRVADARLRRETKPEENDDGN